MTYFTSGGNTEICAEKLLRLKNMYLSWIFEKVSS